LPSAEGNLDFLLLFNFLWQVSVLCVSALQFCHMLGRRIKFAVQFEGDLASGLQKETVAAPPKPER
jgi:hypothetical protein